MSRNYTSTPLCRLHGVAGQLYSLVLLTQANNLAVLCFKKTAKFFSVMSPHHLQPIEKPCQTSSKIIIKHEEIAFDMRKQHRQITNICFVKNKIIKVTILLKIRNFKFNN
jgi:hypothetical protein